MRRLAEGKTQVIYDLLAKLQSVRLRADTGCESSVQPEGLRGVDA